MEVDEQPQQPEALIDEHQQEVETEQSPEEIPAELEHNEAEENEIVVEQSVEESNEHIDQEQGGELVVPDLTEDQTEPESNADVDISGQEHQEVDMIVEDEVVSQDEPEEQESHHAVEEHQEGEQLHQEQEEEHHHEQEEEHNEGEIVHHQVEYIESDLHDEGEEHVEYHVEQGDDDDETSEIILCVDTSATGPDTEYQVIQPTVYIQKQQNAKEINIKKPTGRPGPKSSKPGNKETKIKTSKLTQCLLAIGGFGTFGCQQIKLSSNKATNINLSLDRLLNIDFQKAYEMRIQSQSTDSQHSFLCNLIFNN